MRNAQNTTLHRDEEFIPERVLPESSKEDLIRIHLEEIRRLVGETREVETIEF